MALLTDLDQLGQVEIAVAAPGLDSIYILFLQRDTVGITVGKSTSIESNDPALRLASDSISFFGEMVYMKDSNSDGHP